MKRIFSILATALVTLGAQADNWMKQLDDNRLVCTLSIPGTHDSGTGNGFSGDVCYNGKSYSLSTSWGTNYAQTQDIAIAQQLELGIRAFDLRPAVNGSSLQIHHGIIRTKATMQECMDCLVDFVKANPSEFLVVHMRHEDDGDTGNGDWATLISDMLNSEAYRPYFIDFKPTLTVREMRGKMLIISRDRYGDKPVGGYFQNWPGDQASIDVQKNGRIMGPTTKSVCYVQDYSEAYGEDNGKSKKDIKRESLLTLLKHSTTHTTAHTANIEWTFNFASAYSIKENAKIMGFISIGEVSTSNGYRDNAASTNAAICDYLDSNSGPTGIILMDYVGVDESKGYAVRGIEAVQKIIANNFK